jgi:hypothetical protein
VFPHAKNQLSTTIASGQDIGKKSIYLKKRKVGFPDHALQGTFSIEMRAKKA